MKVFKVVLASMLMTLMFSCSAHSLSGQRFAGTELLEALADRVHSLETQARGFGGGRGFSMNFGGSRGVKSAGASGVRAGNSQSSKNSSAGSAKTARPGLLGFLGGLGLFGWMMLGAGLLGGGFLIYLLLMLLLPALLAFLGRRNGRAEPEELPTSSYSSEELFQKDENGRDGRRF